MHLIGENGAGAGQWPHLWALLFFIQGKRRKEGGGGGEGWVLLLKWMIFMYHSVTQIKMRSRMLAIWCHENKEDQFSRFQINNLSTFFSLWLWLLFLLGRHLLNISFFCCVHLHYLFGWVDLSQLETFSAYVVIVDWWFEFVNLMVFM